MAIQRKPNSTMAYYCRELERLEQRKRALQAVPWRISAAEDAEISREIANVKKLMAYDMANGFL